MSLEFPKNPDAHEVLRVKLEIQTELIKLFTGDEDPTNDRALGWIEIYSKPFNELFTQKVEKDPEFFLNYESKKEEIITDFKQELRKIGFDGGEYKTAA